MPLTPTDVANKQFKIAFRGYSLDEVDQFLDEVETELTRLLRDNNDLQLRASGSSPAAPVAFSAVPAAAPAPATSSRIGLEGQEAALRTLLLAQRTADEAIAEARAEADQSVSEARAEAESTLTSAKSEAGTTLTRARTEAQDTLGKARGEAETTLARSKAEADSTLTASRTKAATLDADIAARIHAATGDLDERRRTLETRIEELRTFEREYRTRLKAYLEIQLRDLDSRQGPDDSGAGVPAGARSSAIGPAAGAAVRRVPLVPGDTGPGSTGPGSTGQGRTGDGSSVEPDQGGATLADDDTTGPAGPPRQASGGLHPGATHGVVPVATVGPFSAAPAPSSDDTAPGRES